jgi:hypothetical protein
VDVEKSLNTRFLRFGARALLVVLFVHASTASSILGSNRVLFFSLFLSSFCSWCCQNAKIMNIANNAVYAQYVKTSFYLPSASALDR